MKRSSKFFNKMDSCFYISNTVLDAVQKIEIESSSTEQNTVNIKVFRFGSSSDDIINTILHTVFNFSLGTEECGHYFGFNSKITHFKMTIDNNSPTGLLEQVFTISTQDFRFIPGSIKTDEAYSKLIKTIKDFQSNDKPPIAKIPDDLLSKRAKKKSK